MPNDWAGKIVEYISNISSSLFFVTIFTEIIAILFLRRTLKKRKILIEEILKRNKTLEEKIKDDYAYLELTRELDTTKKIIEYLGNVDVKTEK